MTLFNIHCGFYPDDGIYESHHNFFMVGQDYRDVQSKVKKCYLFQERRMHIDSILELNIVDGHLIKLEGVSDEDDFKIYKHRELASK